MSGHFAGRTAIVSGASRGIGYGIAERLVADGARVVSTARTQGPLDDAVRRLGAENALGIVGKADDPKHQDDVIAQTLARFGEVSLLVNNAGINPTYGPVIDLDLSAARKIVEVNCIAELSWVQKVHRAWMGDHGGSIVNVSSLSGIRTSPNIGFYGASKAMLNSLTELLAFELGPTIRVNGVAPAVVKTKFAAALYEGREVGCPRGTRSDASAIPRTSAAWVTGQTVVIDGGVSLSAGE